MRNRRGEWYVVIQVILFILIAAAPWLLDNTRLDLPDRMETVLLIVGIILGLGGLALVVAGIVTLGHNLSPLPQPKAELS